MGDTHEAEYCYCADKTTNEFRHLFEPEFVPVGYMIYIGDGENWTAALHTTAIIRFILLFNINQDYCIPSSI